ncbi:MAG TPA: hypothetical protein V6D10_05845 [Trichocoleus sp.]
MTNSSSAKLDVALGNLAIACLSSIAIVTASQMPFLPGVGAAAAGTLGLVGAARRQQRQSLTLTDYADSVGNFVDEIDQAVTPALNWIVGKTEPAIQQYLLPRIPSVAQQFLDAAVAERDDSWLTLPKIIAPKFVLGGRGTGKTTLLRYEARRFKAEVPSGILRIIDLHFNQEDGDWLPGVPPSDYLATKVDEGLAFIRELEQIGLDRIASESTHHPEYKIIIDEWQGFINRLKDEDAKYVVDVVQFVLDELRKYKVNVTLSSKAYKKEMSKVDSSLLSQMDLWALGSSLADSTNRLPLDFDVKPLLSKRHTIATFPGCKYAFIYREANELPAVLVLPNNLDKRSSTYTFKYSDELPEHERWIAENRDRILAMKTEGLSKTKVAQSFDQFGKRDDSNPRWVTLTQLFDSETEGEINA